MTSEINLFFEEDRAEHRAVADSLARLREAAPDMRAALRAIIFQVRQGVVLERDACITEAVAALAKAEGRA